MVFLEKIRAALSDETFVKLTLSQPAASGDRDLRNLYGRIVDLKDGRSLSLVFRYSRRDVTKNVPLREAADAIAPHLEAQFERGHLFTTSGDWQWRADRPDQLKASRATFSAAPTTDHDRVKPRVVAKVAPFLQALGVTDQKGDARPGMADKLRQIQRFAEILGHLLDNSLLGQARTLSAVDMGSGKGYLTFATYDLLRQRGMDIEMTGVETREDLVALTNRVAIDVGFTGLKFVRGTIEDFTQTVPPDLLIALHACNTATDDALFQGIQAKSALILAAPCCHQELRPLIDVPPVLEAIFRHGILHEREAEILTDAIRALLLEIHGYSASVFEFVAPEHTGKNLIISAQRRAEQIDPAPARQRLAALLDFYGIREQRLASLLGER